MHHKAIKAQIRKQLKTRYPNWQRLNKKQKKAIAKRVLDQVVENYNFNQEVITPVEELLGIEAQLPTAGIMDLGEMARFIESHENSVLFKLNRKKRHPLGEKPGRPSLTKYLAFSLHSWYSTKHAEISSHRRSRCAAPRHHPGDRTQKDI